MPCVFGTLNTWRQFSSIPAWHKKAHQAPFESTNAPTKGSVVHLEFCHQHDTLV